MKKLVLSAALMGFASLASADGTLTGPTDAFKAGQDFANGAKGTTAAVGTLKGDGTSNVPKYSSDKPPESTMYGGGKSLIGGYGTNKQAGCVGYKADNAYNQQECDAVNYLTQMPSNRKKFNIDGTKDPLMVNSKDIIANPGSTGPGAMSACQMVKSVVPAPSTTEVCTESASIKTIPCNNTMVPVCGYLGSPVKSYSTSMSGVFTNSTIWPADAVGLYNYRMEVPCCERQPEGTAQIKFTLDTVDHGGYVTINLANLDDAAAIAVNGTTVFAGYPNSGPYYDGTFFPKDRKDYQINYYWNEVSQGVMKTFYASTKLLDYCPAGYGPQAMDSFARCFRGKCLPVSTYTPSVHQGFFCNAEGKFLMNRHEGDGTWGGSVSSSMPLQKGENTITVYWGTGPVGDAWGNVLVYGQIYNVSPQCTANWDDQCSAMRAAVK